MTTSRAPYQTAGLFLGPIIFTLLMSMTAPAGMSDLAWNVVALSALMATWWATEAIPIPATSLLPIIMLPLMGVATSKEASLPYSSPVIYLLLGGFIAAMAMQRWGLHKRIALNILARVGDQPAALIGGFMAASAILSMWISNTATTLMIIPIALTVSETILGEKATSHRFTLVLLIGCAWAASIGGLGTIIGTPPNLFVVAFIEQTTGREISFGEWMMFAVPVVLVMVPTAWFVLTKIAFPFDTNTVKGGSEVVQAELLKLGKMSSAEKRVAYVMGAMAFMWSFRLLMVKSAFITDLLPFMAYLKDTHIAVIGGLAMFLVPSGNKESISLINWAEAERLPWGVILLFGGGLSLASAIQATGLAIWLGESMSIMGTAPLILVMLAIVTMVIFLTELTSNTATTAALVPVMAALAVTINVDPILLAAPVAMAASCAFMLPVATGPNAVVFSTGYIQAPQMIRAGIVLNILGTFIVTGICYALVPYVFG